MSKLYLVRHADAGHRSEFDGPDEQRPLSKRGRRQAEALRDQLGELGITRLLSSPSVRCVQTLEPLAAELGLRVEPEPRLAEGAGARPPLELAAALRERPVAFCSHGDVIPDILDALLDEGLKLDDELRWQKASTWVLRWQGDQLASGCYLPPPA